MGALTPEELEVALDAAAEIVVWREDFVVGLERPARVHVKLDTGMGRLGTRDPVEATRVADAVAASPHLELAGAMTHFATADEPDDRFFGEQLERFAAWAHPLRERHPGLVMHAANSAATLRDPRAHFDMVRTGIAIYGLDPFQGDPAEHGLEPALELVSYVAEVKLCAPGESTGYGRRFVAEQPTTLATVPIGYGDGVRRALSDNADVLVGGRRRPLRGTVSMDNITVDVGPDGEGVARGEDAVLIGAQGDELVTAEEWARRVSTINYEITCAISRRVPRAYHRDGVPVA
jgi:alanine racemase